VEPWIAAAESELAPPVVGSSGREYPVLDAGSLPLGNSGPFVLEVERW